MAKKMSTKAAKTSKVSKAKKTVKKTKKVSSKKTSKKSVSSKSTPTPTPTTQTTTTVSSTPVATTTTSTTSTVSVVPVVSPVSFVSLETFLRDATTALKSAKTELKTLRKAFAKQSKELTKLKLKKLNKTKRAPSGFAKPSPISKELCVFLNKPMDTEMARTEVTKHITQYIKKENLQNPANKKQIKPDTKLASLLAKLQPEDKEAGYTYFNLQKYMKHHYLKSTSTSVSTSS